MLSGAQEIIIWNRHRVYCSSFQNFTECEELPVKSVAADDCGWITKRGIPHQTCLFGAYRTASLERVRFAGNCTSSGWPWVFVTTGSGKRYGPGNFPRNKVAEILACHPSTTNVTDRWNRWSSFSKTSSLVTEMPLVFPCSRGTNAGRSCRARNSPLQVRPGQWPLFAWGFAHHPAAAYLRWHEALKVRLRLTVGGGVVPTLSDVATYLVMKSLVQLHVEFGSNLQNGPLI